MKLITLQKAGCVLEYDQLGYNSLYPIYFKIKINKL